MSTDQQGDNCTTDDALPAEFTIICSTVYFTVLLVFSFVNAYQIQRHTKNSIGQELVQHVIADGSPTKPLKEQIIDIESKLLDDGQLQGNALSAEMIETDNSTRAPASLHLSPTLTARLTSTKTNSPDAITMHNVNEKDNGNFYGNIRDAVKSQKEKQEKQDQEDKQEKQQEKPHISKADKELDDKQEKQENEVQVDDETIKIKIESIEEKLGIKKNNNESKEQSTKKTQEELKKKSNAESFETELYSRTQNYKNKNFFIVWWNEMRRLAICYLVALRHALQL